MSICPPSSFIKVRLRNKIVEGPKHLLLYVQLVEKYCLEEEKAVVQPILQYNGYQAHPECVILSMVGSQDREERRKGVEEILRIRKLKIYKIRGAKKIRKFKVRIWIIFNQFLNDYYSGAGDKFQGDMSRGAGGPREQQTGASPHLPPLL